LPKEFTVKAFMAQLVMKALNMSVFPRAPGLDVKRLQEDVGRREDLLSHSPEFCDRRVAAEIDAEDLSAGPPASATHELIEFWWRISERPLH
jgi:hypothetical protein